MSKIASIVPVDNLNSELFFDYLIDHLADNGKNGTPLFQPQSRQSPPLSHEKKEQICRGLKTELNHLGWRRLWVAVDIEAAILGHVDLRASDKPNTSQRALLGMGVHRDFRKRGLGEKLLAHAIRWAKSTNQIESIDLQVLDDNYPARMFYLKAGFEVVEKVDDRFFIDGKKEADWFFTKTID